MKRMLLFLTLLALAFSVQATELMPVPRIQFLDTSGNPLASGHVHTYISGTTTNQATYTDSGGGTANANPVLLDSGGFAGIWLTVGETYTIKVDNSSNVQQWTVDGVASGELNTTLVIGTTAVTFSSTPTFNSATGAYFSITLTGNVTSSTISNATDGRVVYFNICQDATGGRTFAWPASVLTAPTAGTKASSCTSASFIYDGTNWRELAASSRGSASLYTLELNTETTASGLVHNNTGPSSWVSMALDVWHDSSRSIVNSFPQSAQNSVAVVQALVGGIEIPSNATMASGAGHGSGLAGYARSASTNVGGVGLYGQGRVNANTVSAWGANVVVGNCAIQACTDTNGFTGNSLWGLEINARIVSPATSVNLRGLDLVGAATLQPGGEARAITIRPLGVFESPVIAWKSGLHIFDGSVDVGIRLGTNAEGNSTGSQTIQLLSRDGGATERTAQFQADLSGNLLVSAAGGTVVTFRADGDTQIHNDFVLKQTTANYTLSWDDPAAARAISIPDPLGTDVFVLRDMVQTLKSKTVINPLEGTLSNVPRWIYKKVEHTDITDAATAGTFTPLFTLPANTMIHDVLGIVDTAWAGTGPVSAAVCSVGTAAGSANDLTLDDNFFSAATVYELHDATANGGKGALLFDTTDKWAPYMLVTAGDIEIQCDLTGGNHSTTSAGQARIYILVSQPLANTTTEAN